MFDPLATLQAQLVTALAGLAAHPLLLLALWQALSALVTWLTRARTPEERERFKLTSPYLYAAVAFCEAAGVNLPAVFAWLGQVVRLALELRGKNGAKGP